jgi:hypothetical protein
VFAREAARTARRIVPNAAFACFLSGLGAEIKTLTFIIREPAGLALGAFPIVANLTLGAARVATCDVFAHTGPIRTLGIRFLAQIDALTGFWIGVFAGRVADGRAVKGQLAVDVIAGGTDSVANQSGDNCANERADPSAGRSAPGSANDGANDRISGSAIDLVAKLVTI